jgi:hypothetical protein
MVTGNGFWKAARCKFRSLARVSRAAKYARSFPRRADLLIDHQGRKLNRRLAPGEELFHGGPFGLLEFRQPALALLKGPSSLLVFGVASRQLAILLDHPISEQNQKNARKYHRGPEECKPLHR